MELKPKIPSQSAQFLRSFRRASNHREHFSTSCFCDFMKVDFCSLTGMTPAFTFFAMPNSTST